MRYLLAMAVLIAHFNVVFGTRYSFPISSYNAVGAFFSLSGFLLYGSYVRNATPGRYFRKRLRRILPPYLFIVFLCAIGLSLVSLCGVKEYFSSSGFWKYLCYNSIFMNFMAPDLPGVFVGSPVQAVNGSLWTMKVEIMLYCTVPFTLFLTFWFHRKFHGRSPLIVFIVIYLISVVYRVGFVMLYEYSEKEIYLILGKQFIGQLMFFYSGVFIYFVYDTLLKYLPIAIAASILLYWIGSYIPYFEITLGPIVVSLLTISLSSFRGVVATLNANNISYGIYLFHFPIIQLFYQYGPKLNFTDGWCFIGVILCVVGLSLISWFLMEKPILKGRKKACSLRN